MYSLLKAALSLLLLIEVSYAEQAEPFSPDVALQLRKVSDPELSPDGKWIAYVVESTDLKKDMWVSDIYMIALDGGEKVQLTRHQASDTDPAWSPDGRFLAFLSSRGNSKDQVYMLDRRGGEAFAVTSLKGGVSEFEWSPDSQKLVVVSKDPDPQEIRGEDESDSSSEKKTPAPIVINRLQFKRDQVGFLKELYKHLYVVDLASGKTNQVTHGPYDDSSPEWSPDGSRIAFESNRTEHPDSNQNSDIFVVSSEGTNLNKITSNPGEDGSPSWSPDGTSIAYVSVVRPERMWYATNHLSVVDLENRDVRLLTQTLDRNVTRPKFSSDGKIFFLLETGGNQHLYEADPVTGRTRPMIQGEREIKAFDLAVSGQIALTISEPLLPTEVFVKKQSIPIKQLTFENHDLLSGISLSPVERIRFASKDGTEIDGFVTKPYNFEPGKRYPTLLWNHGGPVSQFSTSFEDRWQILAAAGYLVVSANPRGSSGYGEEFSHAIWADWGNKDYEDVMAAVDEVIEMGYADPERLGVGGWSYGGILTNYIITKTDRFKAAVTGASETNYLSCYGTDHYRYEWETELGIPWENRELYRRLSPLSYVEKIVTPTLILCGEHDWNVPLNQSEQLYQSLKRMGRDTQLVVYPDQSHSISKPSYQKDRFLRFISWFDERLKF